MLGDILWALVMGCASVGFGYAVGQGVERRRKAEPVPVVYRLGQRVLVQLEPGHNGWLKGTIYGFSTAKVEGRESNVAEVRVDVDANGADPKKRDRLWTAPLPRLAVLAEPDDAEPPEPDDDGRAGYRGKVGAN